MVQDTSNIKEKILSTLRQRGPSLPVHIAGATGLSILFASAFLSELFSEKKIKISNMKVGSSPIYFLPGQEHLLENFSQYIKGKEKEAFILLKEKKILKDPEQEPAIRVALRSIKDFAIPFKKNEEIFWRYFTILESEFEHPKIKSIEKTPQLEDKKKSEEKVSKKQELNIFGKQEPKKEKQIIKKKKTVKKKSFKTNEKFFNKVKEFLSKRNIEISDIEGFSKKDLTLKVRTNGEEKVLVAYNKKRVTESDLIKAYKKASELNLQYIVLSLGEPVKKISNFIQAIKDLEEMSQI